MICSRCNQEVGVGEWPWCPHGSTHVAVQPDELIGGFVQEHFGPDPEYFTSKKAMLARADELGLRQVSDGDRKRGGFTLTSKTLEDAKVLLTRGSQTVDTVRCETASFTVRDV